MLFDVMLFIVALRDVVCITGEELQASLASVSLKIAVTIFTTPHINVYLVLTIITTSPI